MSNEKLYVEELKEKFAYKSSITTDEFYSFYKEMYTDIEKSTVRWYIYSLKEQNIIKNVSRGIYVFEDSSSAESDEYIVITIDIIDSSKESSGDFNFKLAGKVNQINKIIKEKLNYKRKFYVSQGDEIQILCPLDDRVTNLLITTLSCLRPYKTRFAISVGNLNQEDILENSWDMNGPIYWNARDRLSEVKKSKKYNGVVVSEYAEIDNICNKFIKTLLLLINKISQKQWDAILSQKTIDDVKDILKELEISQSSFYDRISSSNLDEINDGFDAIFELLKRRRNYI